MAEDGFVVVVCVYVGCWCSILFSLPPSDSSRNYFWLSDFTAAGCSSSWCVQNKLWRLLASYNEKRPINARGCICPFSLTYQSKGMNQHMLVLLAEINPKALKRAELKIYLFKFLTSEEILECFINKVLLWNSQTVLVSCFWHPWEFNSKLWAFFSLELEKETKSYMGKQTAHLRWIHRD